MEERVARGGLLLSTETGLAAAAAARVSGLSAGRIEEGARGAVTVGGAVSGDRVSGAGMSGAGVSGRGVMGTSG